MKNQAQKDRRQVWGPEPQNLGWQKVVVTEVAERRNRKPKSARESQAAD